MSKYVGGGEAGIELFNDWGAEDSKIRSRGCQQNIPYRGKEYMIPYMVGKLGSNRTPFKRGLVKFIPCRGCFHAVPSQNREKI